MGNFTSNDNEAAAQSACLAQGSNLTSIHSDAENSFLLRKLNFHILYKHPEEFRDIPSKFTLHLQKSSLRGQKSCHYQKR